MKNISKFIFILSIICTSCSGIQPITVKNGTFYKGSKPYHFIGTNYWYGPLIAAKEIGDRPRLIKELDLMKEQGIDNLRILVGAEGGNEDFQVKPALQYEQGKYNEQLLDGLDFLLSEMSKRNMYAVLYLNNNWIWSGGMSTYLQWNGYGTVPNPFLKDYTWPEYFEYTQQFHSCEPCQIAFEKHIRFILNRTNTYTGKKYTDDNSIMSWQVANEPRIFTEQDREPFKKFLDRTVSLLRAIDPNTLISTGAEGKASYLDDIDTYQRLHSNPDIDYLTAHMWPKNWGWYNADDEERTLQESIQKAAIYTDEHIAVARRLNKPLVVSEFGFPREKESLSPTASVKNRNAFYEALFKKLVQSKKDKNPFMGINFWGFAGFAKTDSITGKWQEGADFSADPPQEPQGLNSVFAIDYSTLSLVKNYNALFKKD